jgi:hypothetical protein
MTTTQLPVFRKMYDLNLMLIRLVNNFPKQYKYNVGDELIKTSLRLFKHLFAANREYDNKIKRVEHLDNFLDDYDLLKVLIRLANEERMFSIKDAVNLALLTENITKQINGWRNKSSKEYTEDTLVSEE